MGHTVYYINDTFLNMRLPRIHNIFVRSEKFWGHNSRCTFSSSYPIPSYRTWLICAVVDRDTFKWGIVSPLPLPQMHWSLELVPSNQYLSEYHSQSGSDSFGFRNCMWMKERVNEKSKTPHKLRNTLKKRYKFSYIHNYTYIYICVYYIVVYNRVGLYIWPCPN